LVATECSNVIRQTFLTGYVTLTRFPSRRQSFCRDFLPVRTRYGLVAGGKRSSTHDRQKDSDNDDQDDPQPRPGIREIVK
jgi:hypothetical protein